MIPIVSGEYKIADFEAGRFISFQRDPNYWAADIPFKRGTGNLDEIRLEFFGDETAAFEAFKVGEVNTHREFNVAKWDSQFDFPLCTSGDVVKSILPHERPSGMTGFVMNSRKASFADWRVRDAMMHAFNFEFINEAMTGSQQPRITSYWSNSPLGMDTAPQRDASLNSSHLSPMTLTPGTLEGYTLPVSDGIRAEPRRHRRSPGPTGGRRLDRAGRRVEKRERHTVHLRDPAAKRQLGERSHHRHVCAVTGAYRDHAFGRFGRWRPISKNAPTLMTLT